MQSHENHFHSWATASRHNTSEGSISYQNCACGAQRILSSSVYEPGVLALVSAR